MVGIENGEKSNDKYNRIEKIFVLIGVQHRKIQKQFLRNMYKLLCDP